MILVYIPLIQLVNYLINCASVVSVVFVNKAGCDDPSVFYSSLPYANTYPAGSILECAAAIRQLRHEKTIHNMLSVEPTEIMS